MGRSGPGWLRPSLVLDLGPFLILREPWGRKEMHEVVSCRSPSPQSWTSIAFAHSGPQLLVQTKRGHWPPGRALYPPFPFCPFSCGHKLDHSYLFLSQCFPPRALGPSPPRRCSLPPPVPVKWVSSICTLSFQQEPNHSLCYLPGNSNGRKVRVRARRTDGNTEICACPRTGACSSLDRRQE